MGRPRSQSELDVQLILGVKAAITVYVHGQGSERMILQVWGQFEALQGWSFYHVIGRQVPDCYCSGEKGAAVGIYIGRKLVIGTITTSNMPYIRRYRGRKGKSWS